jgi:hypothetical protein
VTVVFDHPTVAELAAYLASRLASEQAPANGLAPAQPATEALDTLAALYRRGCELGRYAESIELAAVASEFRPVFHDVTELPATPKPTQLASGGGPALLCFPPLVAPSLVHDSGRCTWVRTHTAVTPAGVLGDLVWIS